ncbi:MAG: hypothetical protein HYS39_00110 [Proteobacteria bacterium]|nr:hypothetical protein [Pseudomonadota bacterium]
MCFYIFLLTILSLPSQASWDEEMVELSSKKQTSTVKLKTGSNLVRSNPFDSIKKTLLWQKKHIVGFEAQQIVPKEIQEHVPAFIINGVAFSSKDDDLEKAKKFVRLGLAIKDLKIPPITQEEKWRKSLMIKSFIVAGQFFIKSAKEDKVDGYTSAGDCFYWALKHTTTPLYQDNCYYLAHFWYKSAETEAKSLGGSVKDDWLITIAHKQSELEVYKPTRF